MIRAHHALLALCLLAPLPWPLAAQAQTQLSPEAATQEAAPRPPQRFRSPEEGFAALAEAIAAPGEQRLLRVFGDAALPLVRSGDAVADRAARARFTAEYAQKNAILRPAPGRAELLIGADDWPFPIPMRERGGLWRFDLREGGQAMLDRRIGRNELDTIATLRGIVAAQAEYAVTVGRQGASRAYARRFFSTPGLRDGLYWAGEPASPLGPLVGAASAGGYTRSPGDRPQPFHGYLFRMLEGQGPAAEGGAIDYLVGDRMIGGFAVLATPAQYGASGIQSFIVNHRGQIFQQDLGPETARRAAAITRFDPGPGWSRVTE